VTADGDYASPPSDLATMLAEMDSRLQVLQQELESVALPIARRAPEQRRPARRAGDPAGARDEAAPSVAAAEERPRRLMARPTSVPATAPAVDDELAVLDLPGAPRRPPRRRIAGSSQAAVPVPAAPASHATEPPAARRSAVAAAPPSRDATARRSHEPVPATPANVPEALVRQTIVEAENEARQVVEQARQRIAEIGSRTRALLERSVAERARPARPAAPSPARRQRSRTVKAARRAYEGTVTVEAGPFGDVMQLSAFEDALAEIPGVQDVYIRTFERNRAHFELHVDRPTPLIVELQARADDTLSVIAASDSDVRLEIVRGDEG
jgi:hypothetical protein